jgi:cold shock CspA family protein
MQGTVDRVVPDQGFGFIIGPNGEEYFFHRSALKGVDFEELGPGVTVVFQAHEAKGDAPDEHLRAVDVTLAPDAVPAVDNEPLPPGKVAGGNG